MPAVAEVQFKATGSQEVEGAFKSIGTAAGEGTTKIQQNSSAMKSVGQGMKSATSGIAQTATAFATLALSVVGTWRAYRDLGDAQLGVDRANFKVQKSTQAVANAQKLVAGLKAGMKRTDLESVAATSKIIAREEALKKKLKDGSITRKAAKAEQDAINLARSKVGSDKAAELAKAEQDLKNKTEALGLATESAAQKQKHFNDSTQDFYLSLLPTAISVIATAVSGLESMKNIVGGGGGGLIGSLGGIGLVLGAGSLALLAYKNNWLGFRDAIGGVIKWIQDRFGAWKDTIQEVFALIQKHDWGGAFNKIKEAAAAFWVDLKKSVPFFGEVEKLVEKIRAGNWKGAFLQIWKAASDAWNTIKKNIPILGKIEDFLAGIAAGDWKGTFTTIATAIKDAFNATLGKGIEWIFGKDWKSGLDAFLKLQESEASLKKRPLILQYAITINGIIKDITGIDIGKWFAEHPITAASINMPLSGITMSIEDPNFQAGLKKGAEVILGALGTAINTAAKTLDPYFATVIKALNWNTVITNASDAITNAGEAIWIWIFGGIKAGFTGQDWGKLFADFPAAVNDWWAKNAPLVQKAQIENFKGSVGAKALGGLGIKFDATPRVVPNAPEIIKKGITPRGGGSYIMPTSINEPKLNQQYQTVKNKITKNPLKVPVELNTKAAEAKWNAFAHKVQMTKLQVQIAGTSVNIRRGSQAGAYGGPGHQHGYQGTVKRPTMFLAGEGGRPEDVTVRPRGSVQRGGSGGGFYGTVNVYVDGVLRPARYSMGARK